MPGSAKDRKSLKTSLQQRQEQQRDRPTSTAKTSGRGLGGQQSGSTGPQPVHLRLEPTPAPPAWPGEPLNAPKANVYWPGPTRPSAFEIPAPSLPEVRARLDAELAPLPRHGEPLTPAQEAALDLLDQFLSDCVREIRNPDSFDRLVDRTDYVGTQIGRAVANALREAQ